MGLAYRLQNCDYRHRYPEVASASAEAARRRYRKYLFERSNISVKQRKRPEPTAARRPEITDVYTVSGMAILPLRLFLGVTFIYAGIQKLTDPGFFKASAPTYIGKQMLAFSRGSPIAFVMHHMMEHAVFFGLLTIVTEMGIGALVLLGLFTRPAAVVGLILSFTFFLSASWNTYPYFYGSDIVFVMCWITIALAGPGAFALDAVVQPRLYRLVQSRSPSAPPWALPVVAGPLSSTPEPGTGVPGIREHRSMLTRAEALLAAVAAVVLVALGLHSHGGGSVSSNSLSAPAGSTGSSPGAGSGNATAPTPAPTAGSVAGNGGKTATSTPAAGAAASGAPAGYKKIGNISQLPQNSAGSVNDPKSGNPVVVIHESGATFYAYDAVCTHAGCTVQYDPTSKMLICPCHGGEFDPAHNAQVVAGPPPSPLTAVPIHISANGDIYIV